MATKLKNVHLTSVDLVRQGANQEADICLYKGADGAERETNIFKRFLNWLRENPSEHPEEPGEGFMESVEKEYTTFNDINSNRENADKIWRYTDVLTCSIRSIQEDNDLSSDQKHQMMKESLSQFDAAMTELFGALCSIKPAAEPTMAAKSAPAFDEIEEIETKKAQAPLQ